MRISSGTYYPSYDYALKNRRDVEKGGDRSLSSTPELAPPSADGAVSLAKAVTGAGQSSYARTEADPDGNGYYLVSVFRYIPGHASMTSPLEAYPRNNEGPYDWDQEYALGKNVDLRV